MNEGMTGHAPTPLAQGALHGVAHPRDDCPACGPHPRVAARPRACHGGPSQAPRRPRHSSPAARVRKGRAPWRTQCRRARGAHKECIALSNLCACARPTPTRRFARPASPPPPQDAERQHEESCKKFKDRISQLLKACTTRVPPPPAARGTASAHAPDSFTTHPASLSAPVSFDAPSLRRVVWQRWVLSQAHT